MSEPIIPIFTTHHSVGESILTVDADIYKQGSKTEVNLEAAPISCLAIAKHYGQNEITVVEKDISSFWKLYKASTDLGLKLRYGVKLRVASRVDDSDPAAAKTESSVIVFLRNSQAYYDLVPLYSLGSVIDWSSLNAGWSDNFLLAMPFYSSFLARNTLRLNHAALPVFSRMRPLFFLESHALPFDNVIRRAVTRYAQAENFPTVETHQVYYYRDADVIAHQTLKCIQKRSSLTKPQLDHYGSNQFSYESYLCHVGRAV